MVIGFAVGFSLSHGYKFQLFYCYCVQVAPECTVGLFRIQANAWHNCALTNVNSQVFDYPLFVRPVSRPIANFFRCIGILHIALQTTTFLV